VLAGWIGGSPAFAIAAGLSLAAVVLLAGIKEPPRAASATRHPLRDIHEGLAFVRHHPLLWPIFVTQFIFNTALFVIQAVYVPYAIRTLGLSAAGVGMTLGAFGAGMVIGAIFAARVMRRLAMGTVIAIGPIAGFVASLMMLATIWIPSPVLAGSSFFLMGAGPILWVVSTTTLRQTITPQNLLGRVSAINILATGARPVGAAIGAVVGSLSGAEACLFVAAIGFLAQALVILTSPVPRLQRAFAGGCLNAA
jgi:predicted MFS family arabinose efflux permease